MWICIYVWIWMWLWALHSDWSALITSPHFSSFFISSLLRSSRHVASVTLLSLLWCHFCSHSLMSKDNMIAISYAHFTLLFLDDSFLYILLARPERTAHNKSGDGAFDHLSRMFFTKWLIYFNSRTIFVTWLKSCNQSRDLSLTFC